MLPKYDYRRRLPHIQKDNRPLFITFSTYHRWLLPPQARRAVLDCCRESDGLKFELHALVVMPDHVHVLLSALRRSDGYSYDIPEIMRAIKGISAHRINALLKHKGPVWQAESFDHVLRSNNSLEEKMDYICQNPIRAGLVKSEEEYPWMWRGGVPVL